EEHQPAHDDRAYQRVGEQFGIGVLRQVARVDGITEEVDQSRPALATELTMEGADLRITFGGIDERWHARGGGRLLDEVRDLPEELDHAPSERAVLRDEGLRLQRAESVLDQRELAGPVPIDRALPDTGPGCDRFDGQRAVPDLTELIDGRLED